MRVCSGSGSSSSSVDATVAPTQPSEYARCSAAATVAAPVSGQQRDRHRAPRSARPAAPRRRRTRRRTPTRSSHGPTQPGRQHPDGAECRPPPPPARSAPGAGAPRWSTKWAIRLPCIAVSGTSSGARVSVTARITTPPAAPRSSPDVALSSTGKPITRIALAPAAAIECAGAAQECRGAAGRQQPGRRARRRRGHQQHQPGHRAARPWPTGSRPGPSRPRTSPPRPPPA